MGNTFTIEVWGPFDHRNADYAYAEFWRGDSPLAALWHLIRAKRAGFGCVKLEWR